ncbi:hypothetical protein Pelo_15016 [Pelomyxa schiedti]|nr:hypothetical protein Pelo_15016 [Pelomyxa schiedti]
MSALGSVAKLKVFNVVPCKWELTECDHPQLAIAREIPAMAGNMTLSELPMWITPTQARVTYKGSQGSYVLQLHLFWSGSFVVNAAASPALKVLCNTSPASPFEVSVTIMLAPTQPQLQQSRSVQVKPPQKQDPQPQQAAQVSQSIAQPQPSPPSMPTPPSSILISPVSQLRPTPQPQPTAATNLSTSQTSQVPQTQPPLPQDPLLLQSVVAPPQLQTNPLLVSRDKTSHLDVLMAPVLHQPPSPNPMHQPAAPTAPVLQQKALDQSELLRLALRDSPHLRSLLQTGPPNSAPQSAARQNTAQQNISLPRPSSPLPQQTTNQCVKLKSSEPRIVKSSRILCYTLPCLDESYTAMAVDALLSKCGNFTFLCFQNVPPRAAQLFHASPKLKTMVMHYEESMALFFVSKYPIAAHFALTFQDVLGIVPGHHPVGGALGLKLLLHPNIALYIFQVYMPDPLVNLPSVHTSTATRTAKEVRQQQLTAIKAFISSQLAAEEKENSAFLICGDFGIVSRKEIPRDKLSSPLEVAHDLITPIALGINTGSPKIHFGHDICKTLSFRQIPSVLIGDLRPHISVPRIKSLALVELLAHGLKEDIMQRLTSPAPCHEVNSLRMSYLQLSLKAINTVCRGWDNHAIPRLAQDSVFWSVRAKDLIISGHGKNSLSEMERGFGFDLRLAGIIPWQLLRSLTRCLRIKLYGESEIRVLNNWANTEIAPDDVQSFSIPGFECGTMRGSVFGTPYTIKYRSEYLSMLNHLSCADLFPGECATYGLAALWSPPNNPGHTLTRSTTPMNASCLSDASPLPSPQPQPQQQRPRSPPTPQSHRNSNQRQEQTPTTTTTTTPSPPTQPIQTPSVNPQSSSSTSSSTSTSTSSTTTNSVTPCTCFLLSPDSEFQREFHLSHTMTCSSAQIFFAHTTSVEILSDVPLPVGIQADLHLVE